MNGRIAIAHHRAARGMTLVELVVAITVIAIAVTSVLAVLSATAMRSAETLIREQAVSIASAYLNEVLQKNFPPVAGGAGRATLNDLDDYNNLVDANGARDQFGNVVSGTALFTVSVAVTQTALGAVKPKDARRVDVTVKHASGVVVTLSGYRTRYP